MKKSSLAYVVKSLTQKVLGVPGMVVQCVRPWNGYLKKGKLYTVSTMRSKSGTTLIGIEGIGAFSADRFKGVL